MRFLLRLLIIFAIPLAAISQSSTNWSQRISSKTKYPISYWFGDPGGPYTELRIDGRRFDHIRGETKFYLQVPNSNWIVFVQDKNNYSSIVYHIFDMVSDKDIEISAQDSMFGKYIGSSNHLFVDKVESNKDGVIVLCSSEKDAKSTLPELKSLDSIKSVYYLDTSKKAVVAEKTFYYDGAGNVLREIEEQPPF
jgi:hypothetical protein